MGGFSSEVTVYPTSFGFTTAFVPDLSSRAGQVTVYPTSLGFATAFVPDLSSRAGHWLALSAAIILSSKSISMLDCSSVCTVSALYLFPLATHLVGSRTRIRGVYRVHVRNIKTADTNLLLGPTS